MVSGDTSYVLPAGLADYYHHPHIRYVPLCDVEPRMVALAQSTHRTMPELDQFAKITTAILQHVDGRGDDSRR